MENPESSKDIKLVPEYSENFHPIEKLRCLLARDLPNLKRNSITGDWENGKMVLQEEELNSILLAFQVETKGISEALFFRYLKSNNIPSYNPIRDFFSEGSASLELRLIEELASCIQSDTGNDESQPNYAAHFLKKWMVGSMAMLFGEGVNPLMLILAGSKQNTGKTTFLRKLVPEELKQYFAEPKGLDDMKDADLGMLMSENWLILDDEMQNRGWRDWKRMKSLLSTDSFTMRRPYDKRAKKYQRIGSLCATTNNLDLLGDHSGNRRLVPINVLGIDHDRYNAIDKTLLWMEAYALMKSGYEYNLKQSDIELLNMSTRDFEIVDEVIELIEEYFEPPSLEVIGRYTSTQVASVLIRNSSFRNIHPNKVGERLRKMGYDQKRQGPSGSRTYCIELKAKYRYND